MSTYVIGDIQGCFAQLQKLLDKLAFNAARDTLWFTGDLVNRGPQSLEVLRFIKQLGDGHYTVLGNHDLHLLAIAYHTQQPSPHDTLDAILQASDRDALISWLRHRPLVHHDATLGFTMMHAGIAPTWSIQQALSLAQEVAVELQGLIPQNLLQHVYGNQPDQWQDSLSGWDRLRCIINYFTRARLCHPDGRLDLEYKGPAHHATLTPWFQLPQRITKNDNLVFGHWAALGGVTDTPHVYALDTGCAWGCQLTAMCLERKVRVSVECR